MYILMKKRRTERQSERMVIKKIKAQREGKKERKRSR